MNDIDIYELEEILPKLYGETPRRISHQSGVLYAGVPLTVGWYISSTEPYDKKFEENYITHNTEPETILFIDAEQVAANTWLSSPERSILEEAEDMPKSRSVKTISRAMDMPGNFNWDRILEVAERLGYRHGVRRLCSMSDAMSNWEHTIHHNKLKHIPPASKNEDWIPMLCSGSGNGDTEYEFVHEDSKHRVAWEKHPHHIFEELLT